MDYNNPFTGTGWNQVPQSNSVVGNSLFSTPGTSSGSSNPLLAYPGQNINQNQSIPQFSAPNIRGGVDNPGGLPNLRSNTKDQTRTAGYLNALKGALGLQAAPSFLNAFFGGAVPTSNFFLQRENLGDPFYRARQAQAFGQSVDQLNNATAQTQQQLASRGYGYTPSGVNAATLGAMNLQGGQNTVHNFLNTLFANDQYALQAAQAETPLLALFNQGYGTSLGQTAPPGSTQGPNTFEQALQGISSLFSGGAQGANAGLSVAKALGLF